MTQFLAIDIGSGLTKFSNGTTRDHFPSIVGKHNDDKEFSLGIEQHEVITTKGERWLVGDTAKNYIEPNKLQVTTKSTWHCDQGQVILMYAAIAKLFPDGYTGNIALVSGLPTARFAEKQRETVANLEGDHVFDTESASYRIHIMPGQCAVLPQCIGLHFANVVTNTHENWNDVNVGYIDGGTFTTGYALLEEGKFNNLRSGGGDIGLHKLAKALRPIMEDKYHLKGLDVVQVLKWLRKGTGVNFHNGVKEDIDMLELAHTVVPRVYGKLIDEIDEVWQGANSMYVILSSGGGDYLLEYVRRRIPHAQLLHQHAPAKKSARKTEPQIHTDNIYDVVNGYATYGLNKFKLTAQIIDADINQRAS